MISKVGISSIVYYVMFMYCYWVVCSNVVINFWLYMEKWKTFGYFILQLHVYSVLFFPLAALVAHYLPSIYQ
jgi:hypothetical protein